MFNKIKDSVIIKGNAVAHFKYYTQYTLQYSIFSLELYHTVTHEHAVTS